MGLLDELRRLVALKAVPIKTQQVLTTEGVCRYVPDTGALGRHVRLSEREGVDVRLVLQTGEAVVHEPVRALVAADGVDDVEELCVGAEAPVVLCDLGRREVSPAGLSACEGLISCFKYVPRGETTLLDLVDDESTGCM